MFVAKTTLCTLVYTSKPGGSSYHNVRVECPEGYPRATIAELSKQHRPDDFPFFVGALDKTNTTWVD